MPLSLYRPSTQVPHTRTHTHTCAHTPTSTRPVSSEGHTDPHTHVRTHTPTSARPVSSEGVLYCRYVSGFSPLRGRYAPTPSVSRLPTRPLTGDWLFVGPDPDFLLGTLLLFVLLESCTWLRWTSPGASGNTPETEREHTLPLPRTSSPPH